MANTKTITRTQTRIHSFQSGTNDECATKWSIVLPIGTVFSTHGLRGPAHIRSYSWSCNFHIIWRTLVKAENQAKSNSYTKWLTKKKKEQKKRHSTNIPTVLHSLMFHISYAHFRIRTTLHSVFSSLLRSIFYVVGVFNSTHQILYDHIQYQN